MVGLVLSFGMTLSEQVVMFPAPSVAVILMVVGPVITVPDDGDCVMVGEAVQLSVAVVEPE